MDNFEGLLETALRYCSRRQGVRVVMVRSRQCNESICYNDASKLRHFHICCWCEATSYDFDGVEREAADCYDDSDFEDKALGNNERKIFQCVKVSRKKRRIA